MLIALEPGANVNIREVNSVTPAEKQRIMDFLKEAVYCWCNNHPDDWFTAVDFVGGNNANWDGTPLIAITNHYLNAGKTLAEAEDQAGKDLGMILKIVLKNGQTRTFGTIEKKKAGRWRQYRWVPATQTGSQPATSSKA